MPPNSKGEAPRIFQEIEQSAAFYSPSLYAEYLRFYNDLTVEADPLGDQFIALSQTGNSTALSASGVNPKIFAVGIIPPSAVVTGRLLDRSATVANKRPDALQNAQKQAPAEPSDNQGINQGELGGIITQDGYQLAQGTGPIDLGISVPESGGTCAGQSAPGGRVPGCQKTFSVPQIWQGLGIAYKEQFGTDPTPAELQIYTAQVLRETGGVAFCNNFGMLGNHGSASANGGQTFGYEFPNGTTRYFNCYGSAQEGLSAFLRTAGRNANAVQAAKNGDVLGYLTSQAQNGYYEEPVSIYYRNWPDNLTKVAAAMAGSGVDLATGASLPGAPPNSCAFNEHLFKDRYNIPGVKSNYLARQGGVRNVNEDSKWRFRKGSKYDSDCPLWPEGSENKFKEDGSDAAKAADKDIDKTAGVPKDGLNSTELGKKLQDAQRAQIQEIQAGLDAMKRTPPLRMLVNPQKFSISGTKIVNDGNWGRNGPIIEHWGEDQDKISASGKVAGFFALARFNANGPGLTRNARNFSDAWRNFQSLYLLYRNNAGLYLTDHVSQPGNNYGAPAGRVNLSMVGSVYIYYDNILYIGSFDTFSITEDATQPFSAEYSFDFTVRAAFLLDRTDELFLKAGIGDPRERGRGITTPQAPALGQAPSAAFGGSPPPEQRGLFNPNEPARNPQGPVGTGFAGGPPGVGDQLFDIGGG